MGDLDFVFKLFKRFKTDHTDLSAPEIHKERIPTFWQFQKHVRLTMVCDDMFFVRYLGVSKDK